MSRLLDRLRNAARQRSGGGADRGLLAQALQRAADERAQARAAAARAEAPAANDPIDMEGESERVAVEEAHGHGDAELPAAQAAPARRDAEARESAESAAHSERDLRTRTLKRGLAGGLILALLAALIVVSLRLAQQPAPPDHPPVPVFQLDKTLK